MTFGITAIAAVTAFSAREAYRLHLNDLGHRGAVPVPRPDYDRMRDQAVLEAGLART